MLDLGKETIHKAIGHTWTFGKLDLSVLADFCEWVRPRLPDPFASLKELLPFVGEQGAMTLVREARDQAKANAVLDFNNGSVQEFMNTAEGGLQIVFLMLKIHHPTVEKNDFRKIVNEIGLQATLEIIERGRGPLGNADAPAKPVLSPGPTLNGTRSIDGSGTENLSLVQAR